MSLLTQQTTQSPGQFYFATKSSSSVVTEPGYIATGVGPTTPYVAQRVQDTGFGTDIALAIQNNTPTNRWGIGLVNVEGAGNAGSDLNFVAYDNAGAVLSVPLNLDRSSSLATFGGQVVAQNEVQVQSSTDAGHTAELFATSPEDTGLTLTSRISPGNTLQYQVDNDAGAGALFTTCGVNGLGTTVSTVVLNAAAFGNTTGRTIFPASIPPQIGNGLPFTIPFVLNQAWVGGNNTTLTITMTPTQAIFSRPNILVKSQYTSRNNDAANQVNVIPSVQVPTFPSQAGTQLVVGNSSQDSFSQITDFVLVQGTHYSSASTQIVFSYLIGGTAGSGVCSLTALGLA